MKTIKIYGQKRTGTNLLQYLLNQVPGVTVLVNQVAWKHGHPVVVGDYQLIMSKQFHNWRESIMRYKCPDGEEHWTSFESWTNREVQYSNFCHVTPTARTISYERLMSDPDTVWGSVMQFIGEGTPFPGFPENYIDRDGRQTRVKFEPGARLEGIHV